MRRMSCGISSSRIRGQRPDQRFSIVAQFMLKPPSGHARHIVSVAHPVPAAIHWAEDGAASASIIVLNYRGLLERQKSGSLGWS